MAHAITDTGAPRPQDRTFPETTMGEGATQPLSRRGRLPTSMLGKRETAKRAAAARVLALCYVCWGDGFVRGLAGVDACWACAARAEAAWRARG